MPATSPKATGLRARLAQGLGKAGRALPFWPRETAGQHYERGTARAKAEDWSAAAKAIRAALALDDGDAKWHVRLGFVLSRMQDWGGSAAAYRAAIARDKSNAEWNVRLGTVLARAKDWAGAASAFQAAIEQDGGNALWRFRLGGVLAKMQDWPAAASAYEEALARDGSHGLWFVRLGAARAALDDWPAAATASRAATERDPLIAAWHYRLGFALTRLEDWPGAAQAYEAALDLKPADDLCRKRLAFCLMKAGDRERAIAALAPLLAESDRCLETFLAGAPQTATPQAADRRVVSAAGMRTLVARNVVVHGDQDIAYFEQLKTDDAHSRRIEPFYERLVQVFGDDFPHCLPRLHFSLADGRYRYFLFAHCDGDLDPFGADDGPLDESKMACAEQVVDCLTQISLRLGPLFDATMRVEPKTHVFAPQEARKRLELRAKWNAEDAHYAAALSGVLARWDVHAARASRFRQVFSHGDAHGDNVIAGEDGISLLDWESYGYAPLGFDLVTLFGETLAGPQGPKLMDRYFDGLAPEIGQDERRYIVALLGVLLEPEKPIPQAWLDVLA